MATAAAQIAALDGDRGSRRGALGELSQLAEAATSGAERGTIAVACVEPLISLLCADASRVDAVEAREACICLARLCLAAPREMCAELFESELVFGLWSSPGSAVASVLSKDPAELCEQDVVLLGCSLLPSWSIGTVGFGRLIGEHDGNESGLVTKFLATCPLFPIAAPSPARNERLAQLALEMCRNPSGLSALELAGVWYALHNAITLRPALSAVAIRAGVFDVGVAALRKSRPEEWVSCCHATGVQAGAIMLIFREIHANPPGVDPIKLLLDSGAAETVRDSFVAYEQRGPDHVDEGNAMALVHCFQALQAVDITDPQAAPIIEMLEQIPSCFQFIMEHPLVHLKWAGVTTSSLCPMLCALVWGKQEEGGGFSFPKSMTDEVLLFFRDMLDADNVISQFFELSRHFLKPLVNLCISDFNKALLLQNEGLVPLLLSVLFVDDSLRKTADDDVKAAIQADAADSILQIVLFDPGCELLKRSDAAVGALHALVDGGQALTEQVRCAANGALMAIEGRPAHSHEGPEHATAEEHAERHIMCSYQWNTQPTITRLVRDLQARGYRVNLCPSFPVSSRKPARRHALPTLAL